MVTAMITAHDTPFNPGERVLRRLRRKGRDFRSHSGGSLPLAGFLLLWSEPVIEGSIHSPHPVAHPPGRAKPRDAKMLPAFLSGFGHHI